MRTFKPFCLSVMPRAVDMGDRFYMSLNIFAAVDVAQAPKLLLEQTLWQTLPLAAPDFVEVGMPKPQSEYLVYGHAYPHEGAPGRTHVGVRFAGQQKALMVWGERRWDGRQISGPLPFEKVPLTWQHAYGGEGYALNPIGCGHLQAGQAPAPTGLSLPQLESPTQAWHPDPARNVPVGMTALSVEHPWRTRYQGTYDETWLTQRSPAMPLDFDWRYFQVAPPDQQLAQPLVGDEAYEWHHLHPQQALIAGRLPGMSTRAMIQRVGREDLELMATNLKTVVFLPDRQKLILIWQAIAATQDEEFGDIAHLMVSAEWLNQPKTAEHYHGVLQARRDREKGMLAVLQETDLLPEGMPFEPLLDLAGTLNPDPPESSYAAKAKAHAEKRFEAARAEVAKYGLDPDEHATPAKLPVPEMPKDVKDLPAFFEKWRAEHAQSVLDAKAYVEQSLQNTERELAPFGYDGSLVRSEIATPPMGPPQAWAGDRIDSMKQLAAMEKASGVEIGEVAEMAVDAKLHAEWREGDRAAMEGYRQFAHHQKPASRAEARFAERQKEWVRERLSKGEPLAGFDLTGADLRGFDLSGANLDRALMESACLDGVCLNGASMKEVMLAHSSMQGCQLAGANLTRANLGKAQMQGVQASGAMFDHAVCHGTDFTQADLSGARFDQVQWMGVTLLKAKLDGAKLDGCLFNETCLDGASLVGASAARAVFMKASMKATDMRQLQAERVVFYGVALEQLRLDGARLRGASFVEGSSLLRCSLRQVDLSQACARGTRFEACDLSGANLDKAMLSHADFTGACLRSASAVEAMFMRAVLDKADMCDMNLRDALLTSALARGTLFVQANLFGADLARLQMSTTTRLDGALAKRARLYPRVPLVEERA